MKVYGIVLVLFQATALLAQNQVEIDSLEALLPKTKDTVEVNVLYSIARFEFNRDPEKALRVAKESLQKSRALKFLNGKVMAYKQIGVFYNLYKNDFDTSALYLDSAEALAVTAAQKASVYAAIGGLCSRKGEFEKSHTYLLKAIDLIAAKESPQAFNAYTYLALNLSLLGRHREAIQYYKKCVTIANHNKNNRDVGLALSNLGLSYMNQDEYDSALLVYKQLYALELKYGNPLENPTMLSELGKLYFEKGETDTAYYFMHTGLRAAYIVELPYAISRSLSTLGRYHLRNNADSALFYGRKLHRQVNHTSALALEDVTYILAKAHGKLKHYDSAFYYFDQYAVYHDSVFQEKQTKQIAQLEAQYELKRKQEEIKRLEAARQNEVLKRNMMAGGLGLSVLIGILVFFVLRARIRARKKEIEWQNLQLANFTQKMIEKSQLVEELSIQLEQFKSEVIIPRERIETVSEILHTTILTERDWEEFKVLFNRVNPKFFAELKLRHPDLTQAETRLAALIILNLNTREMANMLGISPDSANKARYRLRKKLNLQPEQDLKTFIESGWEI
jgi:tetratricopeptide (TPR) repeat protein